MTRIVVAEDDADVHVLLGMLLEDRGYQLDMAKTGQQALDMINEDGADLALLDIAMPGELTGLDVTRRLRAAESTRKIPIILLSARAREEDVQAGLGAGADDYIVKPFDAMDLIARIDIMLGSTPKPD